MRYAGIDLGSRTVKLAIVEGGKLVLSRKVASSYNPMETVMKLLDGVQYDVLTATGYGRHLIKEHIECGVISEISAFARGGYFLESGCTAILDIGGQDTKAISLDSNGHMSRFEMNDKCAAGTGRFLEVMAATLGYTFDEFAEAALEAEHSVKINSMCTVFAESEVVSLISRGGRREDVALGIHRAIIGRSVSLLKRVAPFQGRLLFAGGVALSKTMKQLLEKETGSEVVVPDDPQIVGAIGAALSCKPSEL